MMRLEGWDVNVKILIWLKRFICIVMRVVDDCKFRQVVMKCVKQMFLEMSLDRVTNLTNVGFDTRTRNFIDSSRKKWVVITDPMDIANGQELGWGCLELG